jgi:hypothetical protein
VGSPDRHDRDRLDPEGRGPEPYGPEYLGPGSRGPYRHEQPRGSEPLSARSPLRLRAIMSGAALVIAVAAAIVFALGAQGDGSWAAAGICAAVAVIAAVDLVVIARRARS